MVYNGEKNVILGSNQNYDLRVAPFSRRGSFVCILEDPDDRNLYLSISRSPESRMQRKNLIRMIPTKDNKELPYTYEVMPGKLTIHTYSGTIEMCFDRDGHLHIRQNTVNLRFVSAMMLFEHCTPTEDGCIEAAYVMMGKLLFVPLRGAMYTDAMWVPKKSRANDFMIEFLPSVETGIAEAVIHEYYSNGLRNENYEDFDAVVKDSENDFAGYMKRFAEIPKMYEDFGRLAAWIIWTHSLGPARQLQNEAVYMTRTTWLRAYCEQQAFQAMAARNEPIEAARILISAMDHQDENGWLPESESDNGTSHLPAASAVLGFAVLYLMEYCDFSLLPSDIKSKLYKGITGITHWWLTRRDCNQSGIPQYYRAGEAGWNNTSFIKLDFPLQSGDLLAMLVLLTEACAKLAVILGIKSEYEKWSERSNQLLTVLLSEFWDGSRFIARRAADGKTVKHRSALALLPVILGERLPNEVSAALMAQITNEKTFLSPKGILSEMRSSPDYREDTEPFDDGYLTGAMQVLFAIGLEQAGYPDDCRMVAQRWCDTCVQQGFLYRHSLCTPEQLKCNSKLNPWNSWTAACFLILASNLN